MPVNSRSAFGLRLRPGLHVRDMHLVRWGGFETRPYHRCGHCRTHHAGRSGWPHHNRAIGNTEVMY